MLNENADTIPSAPSDLPEAIPYADASVPAARDVALTSGVTRGDVATLAVRIVGIYVLLQALPAVVLLMRYGFSPFRAGMMLPLAISIAILGGAGAALVFRAKSFAGWLLPNVAADPGVPPTAGSAEGLQAVAFAVIGVVLAAQAVPQVASLVWRNTYASLRSLPSEGGMEPAVAIVRPAAEFVIGLGLFFRGKRLAAYWQRLPAWRPTTHKDRGPL